MYNAVRKTAGTVSEAVKEFLNENSLGLESISANLVSEKIFTDKKEYTVEILKKLRPANSAEYRPSEVPDADINLAMEIVSKLLALTRFTGFTVTPKKEGDMVILKITTNGKDGLLIGKNGQNIIAMQYLLSMALDRQLKKHSPIIIDVDDYRDKRLAYLKVLCKAMAEKAVESQSEAITDLLPSYERKMIHEEIKNMDSLKTFSVGKGSYKKVVITSLL